MYYLGVDLGQKRDPTALALVRRIEYRCANGGPRFDRLGVVGLERVPLGTPYPVVVERLKRLTQRMDLLGRGQVVVEAFGAHDDLVMAVALAVWKAKRIFTVSGMTRLPGI